MLTGGAQSVILVKPQTAIVGSWQSPLMAISIVNEVTTTAFSIINGLSASLSKEEFKPSVLEELRGYVARLLGELGGYYRLPMGDPLRGIWRTIFRVRGLYRAEGELERLLSAIDERLKRVEERRFNAMSILLGALGVFGALEFILGVFSLWGINTYTIIAAGAVALTITTLLSAIIHNMRR